MTEISRAGATIRGSGSRTTVWFGGLTADINTYCICFDTFFLYSDVVVEQQSALANRFKPRFQFQIKRFCGLSLNLRIYRRSVSSILKVVVQQQQFQFRSNVFPYIVNRKTLYRMQLVRNKMRGVGNNQYHGAKLACRKGSVTQNG